MTTYDATITGREEVAEDTIAFYFTKPTGFVYKPGQAIDVILTNQPTTEAQSSRHTVLSR